MQGKTGRVQEMRAGIQRENEKMPEV